MKLTGRAAGLPLTLVWVNGRLSGSSLGVGLVESYLASLPPSAVVGPPLAQVVVDQAKTSPHAILAVAERAWDQVLTVEGLDPLEPETIGETSARRAKHAGPGPHPGTGTTQDVHGHGASPRFDASSLARRLREPDAGFSHQVMTGQDPVTGYMVSPYPERSDGSYTVETLTPEALARYVTQHRDLLQQPDHYFGGWHDPATGQIFLDVAIRTETAELAEMLALRYDQIAYFDLQAGRSVTVNRAASSGGQVKTNDDATTRDRPSRHPDGGPSLSTLQRFDGPGSDPRGTSGRRAGAHRSRVVQVDTWVKAPGPPGPSPVDERSVRDRAPEAYQGLCRVLNRGQGVDRAIGALSVLPTAAHAWDELVSMALEQTPGALVLVAPVKQAAKARDKVGTRHGGDWAQLGDMVRGAVLVETPDDLDQAVEAVKTAAKVQKFTIQDPETPAKHQATRVRLTAPNGLSVEVMVTTRDQWATKTQEPSLTLWARVEGMEQQATASGWTDRLRERYDLIAMQLQDEAKGGTERARSRGAPRA